MEVILREDIKNIGKTGDVITVKEGYARNYLLPKKYAVEVTDSNLKIIEAQRKSKEQKLLKEKKKAQVLADRLAGLSCTVAMNVGEEDKLYGAVTNADIAESLAQEGIVLDKRDIILEEEIHKLGIYHFKVKLHPEIAQEVKLWVVKK
ncbi:MAG: 50S ribosomal protein L9 [Candidatus Omnitrophota bacterium]